MKNIENIEKKVILSSQMIALEEEYNKVHSFFSAHFITV